MDGLDEDRAEMDLARHRANVARLLADMARHGNGREDPVRTVPAALGDRWSSLIMHLLSAGMLRHAEIKRLVGRVSAEGEISQRVLTLKLRLMERDGLVARRVTGDVPPRVEYRLTQAGHEAYAHFSALVRWAERQTAAIREARAAYDRRHPDVVAMLQQSRQVGSGG
ncbi:MAG: hypothetical protein RLY78_1797 [Pseudomonadota bacterium]